MWARLGATKRGTPANVSTMPKPILGRRTKGKAKTRRGGRMKTKADIINFYKENRAWLDMVLSNVGYPRTLRAAAGAVIEVAIEEGIR